MAHIPENIKVAARFILLALQRTLTEHTERAERHNDQQLLKQGLTAMTYHLPAVMYNAGITKTLLPASHIRCQLQNHLLEVDIQEVGAFLFDIRHNCMVTFTRPKAAEDKKPATADSLARYSHTGAGAFGSTTDAAKGLSKKRDPAKAFMTTGAGMGMTALSAINADKDSFTGIDHIPGGLRQPDRMMAHTIPLPRHYISRFDPNPGDAAGQPSTYFIHMHVEDMAGDDTGSNHTNVIRVHPKD